ncbi:MAG: hypothetical protein ACI8PZ_003295 [Myxococcota bacterium]|jgi:hypothetical protein
MYRLCWLLLVLPTLATAAERGDLLDLLRATGKGPTCAQFVAVGDTAYRDLFGIAHDGAMDASIRGRAVSFLSCFPTAPVQHWLAAEVTGGEIPLVRSKACSALATAFPDDAAAAIVPALSDAKVDVRTAAAKALGGLSDPAADKALRARLNREPNARVKDAIREALRR